MMKYYVTKIAVAITKSEKEALEHLMVVEDKTMPALIHEALVKFLKEKK